MRRKIVAYSCVILSSILLVLLALSVWAIQAKGYVFFQEYLPYLIMSVIVIFYLVGWYLFVGDPKHKKNLVLLICFALFIVVSLYGTLKVKRLNYKSVNEDFSHSMILRYSDKKNLLDIYERKYFILAKKIKVLKHVEKLEDIEWIHQDYAILRYQHQNGEKGIEPISFYQPKQNINELKSLLVDDWCSNHQNIQVQINRKGIQIIWDGKIEFFQKEKIIYNEDGIILENNLETIKYIIYPNANFKQHQDEIGKKEALQIIKVSKSDFECVLLNKKLK